MLSTILIIIYFAAGLAFVIGRVVIIENMPESKYARTSAWVWIWEIVLTILGLFLWPIFEVVNNAVRDYYDEQDYGSED